jgi:hypothetical protein
VCANTIYFILPGLISSRVLTPDSDKCGRLIDEPDSDLVKEPENVDCDFVRGRRAKLRFCLMDESKHFISYHNVLCRYFHGSLNQNGNFYILFSVSHRLIAIYETDRKSQIVHRTQCFLPGEKTPVGQDPSRVAI